MSMFTKFKSYRLLDDVTYILDEDLYWDVGKLSSKYELKIDKGTTFDISVPKVLRFLQSPHDKEVLLAAAIHDELLKQKFDIPFASAEFRRACVARGSSKFKAWRLFYVTLIYLSIKNKIK